MEAYAFMLQLLHLLHLLRPIAALQRSTKYLCKELVVRRIKHPNSNLECAVCKQHRSQCSKNVPTCTIAICSNGAAGTSILRIQSSRKSTRKKPTLWATIFVLSKVASAIFPPFHTFNSQLVAIWTIVRKAMLQSFFQGLNVNGIADR